MSDAWDRAHGLPTLAETLALLLSRDAAMAPWRTLEAYQQELKWRASDAWWESHRKGLERER